MSYKTITEDDLAIYFETIIKPFDE